MLEHDRFGVHRALEKQKINLDWCWDSARSKCPVSSAKNWDLNSLFVPLCVTGWLTVVVIVVWLAQRYDRGLVILRCHRVSGTWKMPAHVIPCFIYLLSFFPFICFRRLTITVYFRYSYSLHFVFGSPARSQHLFIYLTWSRTCCILHYAAVVCNDTDVRGSVCLAVTFHIQLNSICWSHTKVLLIFLSLESFRLLTAMCCVQNTILSGLSLCVAYTFVFESVLFNSDQYSYWKIVYAVPSFDNHLEIFGRFLSPSSDLRNTEHS